MRKGQHVRKHRRRSKSTRRSWTAGKKQMWERNGIVFDPNLPEPDVFDMEYESNLESKKKYLSGRGKRKPFTPAPVKGGWVRYRQKYHTPTFSAPFWMYQKEVSSLVEAKEEEAEYNQFNNSHDRIKVIGFSTTRPQGIEDKYGAIWPSQADLEKWGG